MKNKETIINHTEPELNRHSVSNSLFGAKQSVLGGQNHIPSGKEEQTETKENPINWSGKRDTLLRNNSALLVLHKETI